MQPERIVSSTRPAFRETNCAKLDTTRGHSGCLRDDCQSGAGRDGSAASLARLQSVWTNHVKTCGVGLLSNEIDSWMTGINRNVEGKNTRIIARYSGSAPAYRARADETADRGYRELSLA